MADKNYTAHQQGVIKRYYKNQDALALQRAQELVTELYLSEGKGRQKVWESLEKNLEKAGVPANQVAHLRQSDSPELVAALISKMI